MKNKRRIKAFSIKAFSWVFCFHALFLLGAGCASVPAKREVGIGYREVGLASWYGKDFHGRPTSSGEIYNMFGFSAAHRTLPLGTFLRVTDRKTGRRVEVKVNDRGPFVGDRILDLSYGAAKGLGIIGSGTAEVEIEVIGGGPTLARGRTQSAAFIVQVGSFEMRENALRMKEKIERYYQRDDAPPHGTVYLETYESNTHLFHRVRIGPFRSDGEAWSAAGRLSSQISAEGIRPVVLRAD